MLKVIASLGEAQQASTAPQWDTYEELPGQLPVQSGEILPSSEGHSWQPSPPQH